MREGGKQGKKSEREKCLPEIQDMKRRKVRIRKKGEETRMEEKEESMGRQK